jgi:hypothetical protein
MMISKYMDQTMSRTLLAGKYLILVSKILKGIFRSQFLFYQ